MYDLIPYFTNDGSVGLFSEKDDDIYHSVYGALSESWEKFIIPSELSDFIQNNKQVKILDICYGIGYNTQTALSVFTKNNLKKNKFHNFSLAFLNFFQKFFSKKIKIFSVSKQDIETVHTDNILRLEKIIFAKKKYRFSKINLRICRYNRKNIGKIYADNISSKININNHNQNKSINLNLSCKKNIRKSKSELKLNSKLDLDFKLVNSVNCRYKIINAYTKNGNYFNQKNNSSQEKILIDAIEIDKTLFGLSPFITSKCDKKYKKYLGHNFINNQKFRQVEKIKQKQFIKINSNYKILPEVKFILLKKLMEQNFCNTNDKNLSLILSNKKLSPIFDKKMIKLAKFYQNLGYKHSSSENKLDFLHNIYYRYVSFRNILGDFSSFLNLYDLNFHAVDARMFVLNCHTKYNFIFLDAFTPTKCPCLWSLQFFEKLFSLLDNDGKIVTYSSSAAVRNAMIKAGFFVGKTFDKNSNKFVGTIASKNIDAIKYKLDEKDLDLVHSKAGICFEDIDLSQNNYDIIKQREEKIKNSNLLSSTKVLRKYEYKK